MIIQLWAPLPQAVFRDKRTQLLLNKLVLGIIHLSLTTLMMNSKTHWEWIIMRFCNNHAVWENAVYKPLVGWCRRDKNPTEKTVPAATFFY